MPGQDCKGEGPGPSDCPYHVFRTSDDVYNHYENIVNNINSVTPYLTQADSDVPPPRSRPGAWGYPDMLETGNLGCGALQVAPSLLSSHSLAKFLSPLLGSVQRFVLSGAI